jgi:hypothetical protein
MESKINYPSDPGRKINRPAGVLPHVSRPCTSSAVFVKAGGRFSVRKKRNASSREPSLMEAEGIKERYLTITSVSFGTRPSTS